MNQRQFANLAGVYPAQVSNWERGERKPAKRRLETMAAQYGWPLSIFEEAGPMPDEVVKWPSGMTLPHHQQPLQTSPRPTHSDDVPTQPTDQPSTDPFQGLPEPAIPQREGEWIALDVIYRGAKSFVEEQARRGHLIDPADMAFWIAYLRVAAVEDAARAASARQPNGGHAAS